MDSLIKQCKIWTNPVHFRKRWNKTVLSFTNLNRIILKIPRRSFRYWTQHFEVHFEKDLKDYLRFAVTLTIRSCVNFKAVRSQKIIGTIYKLQNMGSENKSLDGFKIILVIEHKRLSPRAISQELKALMLEYPRDQYKDPSFFLYTFII